MVDLVQARLNGLYDLILPKHRADRPEWYTEAGWERARLEALRQAIQANANPVVYYVGAEEGEMAALCQIWGARVVLFEPNPLVWPNILAIWRANGLLDPAGRFFGFASDTTQLEPFGRPCEQDVWPQCAFGEVLAAHGFCELRNAGGHPQTTIDAYVERSGLVPTVVTFDCEGSEGNIVRGAVQTLVKHRPVIVASIHPEFMRDWYGESADDLRAFLRDFGYRETWLDHQHELHVLYEPRLP